MMNKTKRLYPQGSLSSNGERHLTKWLCKYIVISNCDKCYEGKLRNIMKAQNRGYNDDRNNYRLTYTLLKGSKLSTLHTLVYLILTTIITLVVSSGNWDTRRLATSLRFCSQWGEGVIWIQVISKDPMWILSVKAWDSQTFWGRQNLLVLHPSNSAAQREVHMHWLSSWVRVCVKFPNFQN